MGSISRDILSHSRVACIVATALVLLLWLPQSGHLRGPPATASSAYSQSASSFPSALHDFFQAQLHPIAAPNFTSQSGQVYSLSEQPRFTHLLGKKILILDTETRSVDGPGGLLDAELPVTNALHYLTFGRLSHYLFAQLHGYDYKLVRYPEQAHRHRAWNKVTAMREAIRHYDYVVFMDGDAIFTHPNLPLEWLLNYWAITDDTIVTLAQDPDAPLVYNLRGIDRNLNTGFIIAQQTPRSEEFFDAWEACPFNEMRYPGCAHTVNGPMYDQTALNDWPRYDYAEDIKILPCNEVNRFPGSGDCEGEFVAHYWPGKDMGYGPEWGEGDDGAILLAFTPASLLYGSK